jgi:tetratricopeptide (TPR) repeat protein
MTIERPPRLEHDAELGAIVRAAKDVHVGPERLAANAARIKTAIATGGSFALWKLLVPLLLISGAAAVTWWLLGRDEEPGQAPALAVAPAPDAAIVPPDAAGPEVDAAAPEQAAPEQAAPEPAAPAPAAPEAPAASRVRRPPIPRATPDAAPPDAAPPAAAPPATSDLPEQIRLYDEALAAAARGALPSALDRLDELLRRFPATPLRPDAELTRAELLARADRYDEAVTALEAQAGARAHAGRRAELLRTLGDLHRKHGDCTRATDAYTRALAAHPGERDRRDAERGRDRCAPQ